MRKRKRISAEQMRAARAWLNMSQAELGQLADVERKSILEFESGRRELLPRTLEPLARALEERGIEFLYSGDIPVGLRMTVSLPHKATSKSRSNV